MLNKKFNIITFLTIVFTTVTMRGMVPGSTCKKLRRELHQAYNAPFTTIDERIRDLTTSNVLCNRLLSKYQNGLRKNSENKLPIIAMLNNLKKNIWEELQNLKEY